MDLQSKDLPLANSTLAISAIPDWAKVIEQRYESCNGWSVV